MRHVKLTCKNHPDLRWMCKSVAWTDSGGYNGSRNIFFVGKLTTSGDYSPVEGDEVVMECSCPTSDLVRAPEDLAKFPGPITFDNNG